MGKALFSDIDVSTFISQQRSAMDSCADSVPAEVLRRPNLAGNIQNIANKFRLVIPALSDPRQLKPAVTDRGADGWLVKFNIPFSGDSRVFGLTPSSRSIPSPRATVFPNRLEMTYRSTDGNASVVKADYEREIQHIEEALQVLRQDLAGHLNGIDERVQASFKRREDRLRATADFANAFR